MPATIEYIESIIAAFENAAEANVHTPGREGTVVTLDEEIAGDVMITADLHGHRSNFAMIRRIADLDATSTSAPDHSERSLPRRTEPIRATAACMSHTK